VDQNVISVSSLGVCSVPELGGTERVSSVPIPPTEHNMEPFRSSFFSVSNTGSEPSRDLRTIPFHSIPSRSGTEHILALSLLDTVERIGKTNVLSPTVPPPRLIRRQPIPSQLALTRVWMLAASCITDSPCIHCNICIGLCAYHCMCVLHYLFGTSCAFVHVWTLDKDYFLCNLVQYS
jgi:hypothetical protein